MIKYILITFSVALGIGFFLGSTTISPKIIKEVRTDTLRVRDTIKVKEEVKDWHTNDSIRQTVIKQGFEINFKKMNAYYIKRTYQEGAFFTVIGFKDKDNNLQDDYFTCSEEQHKRLVRQFKEEIGH